jgi:hypothetical protein
VAITDRAAFARLHALDRDLLLQSLARLPQGSPDLSGRSVTDRRFAAFLLSDHPAATFERCRRRAAYLDDTARPPDVLHGWLAKLDAIPPRPGEAFDDSLRRFAATTSDLLDQQAARLPADAGEPDPVRAARQRERYGRYPTRYLGRTAARQPIPPEQPSAEVAAVSAKHGGVARYRMVGITDERDSCDCCGRTNLKRVVVLHDGDDHLFFGSHCAAKLLGKPVGDVKRQATAAQWQRVHGRADDPGRRTTRGGARRGAGRRVPRRPRRDQRLRAGADVRAVRQQPADDRQPPHRPAGARPRRVRPLPGGHPAHGQRDRAHARAEGGHER